MSLFIDTLTDEVGEYEYGHCYADDDLGREFGCGMEYAYRPDLDRLDRWHDAVGQVTTKIGFTDADRDALEREHAPHMEGLRCPCGNGDKAADSDKCAECIDDDRRWDAADRDYALWKEGE